MIDVYLEIGTQRTFACALAWPGWARAGRDEQAALDALVASGPRYARMVHAAGLPFEQPVGRAALAVIERLPGNATTDFGAPDAIPAADARPLDEAGVQRCQALLRAGWGAFDAAVQAASGTVLRMGPRGGGRNLAALVAHVLSAEQSYLARLGVRLPKDDMLEPAAQLARTREAILQALEAAQRGELPARGPRGGRMWPPQFFVRRAAWHVLDHAWELEDRRT